MNVFAHTACGTSYAYPEFISVNTTEGEGADVPEGKDIRVIVRSPAYPDGSCGQSAAIEISRQQALELAHALIKKCA